MGPIFVYYFISRFLNNIHTLFLTDVLNSFYNTSVVIVDLRVYRMNLWLKLVVDQLLQVYYFTTHPIRIRLLLLSISSHATYSMMGGNELLPPLQQPPT